MGRVNVVSKKFEILLHFSAHRARKCNKIYERGKFVSK